MTEYIVIMDAVGVPGPDVEVPAVPAHMEPGPVAYHTRGETVEIEDGDALDRLIDLGAVVAFDDATQAQRELAESRRVATEASYAVTHPEASDLPSDPTEPTGDSKTEEEDSGDSTGDDGDPKTEEEVRLTKKQALVKEAGDRGLDTDGTSADLEARIAADKEAKGD